MDRFSIKDVAFSGYRLLASRPLTALAWFLFYLVVGLGTAALTATMVGPQMAALNEMQQAGADGFDPSTAMALSAQIVPFQILSVVLALVIGAITVGAATRAVLRPTESGLGYLRFGKDELRLLVTTLVIGLLIGVAYVVAFIPAMITLRAVGGPAAMPGMSGGADLPLDAILAACGAALPGIALLVVLSVKLSLASAQTMGERGIRIFGSWSLTKGNFWRLLAAYVLAGVPLLLATIAVGVAMLALRGEGFDGVGKAMNAMKPTYPTLEAVLAPAAIASAGLSAILNLLVMAAFVVPTAVAYKAIAKAPDEVAGDDEED